MTFNMFWIGVYVIGCLVTAVINIMEYDSTMTGVEKLGWTIGWFFMVATWPVGMFVWSMRPENESE